MEILGLIPARIGSTGVKRKNIRPLAGRPLLEYTVEVAQLSGLGRIVLSTESEEIAEVGQNAGVEVPFKRPAELAATESKAIEVVTHALSALEELDGWRPDAVMYLQPTSPFRTAELIDHAIQKFQIGQKNSVISFHATKSHPAYMFIENRQGRLVSLLDPTEYRRERRQDMISVYSLNNTILLSSAVYLAKAARSQGLVVDLEDFTPIHAEWPATIDIDNEQDFLFADFVMQQEKGMRT